MATLPGQLYRITTPAGSGLEPRVTRAGGRVRASLRPTGTDGPHEVRIVLNREVRWDIRLPAGAGEQQLDLARGRVTRVEVGASGLVEMRLPEPAGTVPVRLTGAVGTLIVSAPAGVPVRVRLDDGADRVPEDWPAARDRYVLRAHGEVGQLVVRERMR